MTSNKHRFLPVKLIAIISLSLIPVMTAIAGPGGKILTGLVSSPIGRLALGFVFFVLLPLIVFFAITNYIRNKLVFKKAYRAIERAGELDERFTWKQLEPVFIDSFEQIHTAWAHDDMTRAAQYMTADYLQNQQEKFLNKWREKDLQNHCELLLLNSINPVYAGMQDNTPTIIVRLDVKMIDYLYNRSSGKIVYGDDKEKEAVFLYTFELQQDHWMISKIEETEAIARYYWRRTTPLTTQAKPTHYKTT